LKTKQKGKAQYFPESPVLRGRGDEIKSLPREPHKCSDSISVYTVSGSVGQCYKHTDGSTRLASEERGGSPQRVNT